MNRYRKDSRGFTIVELSIAMTLLSVLLIVIVFLVIRIGGIYTKGVTMKSVNQAGQVIVSDMRMTIGDAGAFPLAASFIEQKDANGRVAGGRLCTGEYSYVWNIGTTVETDASGGVQQENNYDGDGAPIRFVRSLDNDSTYCTVSASGEMPAVIKGNSTELLSESDLAIQDFAMTQLTTNMASGASVYKITMLISNADTESIESASNTCRPPSVSDDRFCAVNEFGFTVHASGKRGG